MALKEGCTDFFTVPRCFCSRFHFVVKSRLQSVMRFITTRSSRMACRLQVVGKGREGELFG